MKLLDLVERLVGPKTRKAVSKLDAWANYTTGLGTSRDKAQHAEFYASSQLSDPQLSALFNENDLARKVVALRPQEAFRAGYTVTKGGKPDTNLTEKARELGLDRKVLEAWMWGRLYGGALLIVGAIDGSKNLTSPLKPEKVQDVKWLRVVDRRFVHPTEWYDDPMGEKFGEPKVYRVYTVPQGMLTPQSPFIDVHESRTFRFEGATVDLLRQRELKGWSGSVLQTPYEILRQFDTTFQAVAHLTQDASQAVFGMEGLIDAIANGQEDTVRTRMEMLDMGRSVARAVIVDVGSNETFERKPTQFSGLPEVIDRLMMRTSAAADTPVSLLFGRSPSGLSASGEADVRNFYATVETEQVTTLGPMLRKLYQLLGGGDKLEIKFNSLWSLSDLEQADLEFKVSQKDKTYFDIGALTASEIAISRYGSGAFSSTTEVDTKLLKKLQKMENEERLKPPPPPPTFGVNPADPNAPPPEEGAQPEDGEESDDPNGSEKKPKANAEADASVTANPSKPL
jgi:phage-related protein (TIGR01555 family)